jgi:hypothetical protein
VLATITFTDIVDSTAMAASMEAARARWGREASESAGQPRARADTQPAGRAGRWLVAETPEARYNDEVIAPAADQTYVFQTADVEAVTALCLRGVHRPS